MPFADTCAHLSGHACRVGTLGDKCRQVHFFRVLSQEPSGSVSPACSAADLSVLVDVGSSVFAILIFIIMMINYVRDVSDFFSWLLGNYFLKRVCIFPYLVNLCEFSLSFSDL